MNLDKELDRAYKLSEQNKLDAAIQKYCEIQIIIKNNIDEDDEERIWFLPQIYFYLGLLYTQVGLTDKAMESYQDGLNDKFNIYMKQACAINLSALYAEIGKEEEAIELLKRMVKLRFFILMRRLVSLIYIWIKIKIKLLNVYKK